MDLALRKLLRYIKFLKQLCKIECWVKLCMKQIRPTALLKQRRRMCDLAEFIEDIGFGKTRKQVKDMVENVAKEK